MSHTKLYDTLYTVQKGIASEGLIVYAEIENSKFHTSISLNHEKYFQLRENISAGILGTLLLIPGSQVLIENGYFNFLTAGIILLIPSIFTVLYYIRTSKIQKYIDHHFEKIQNNLHEILSILQEFEGFKKIDYIERNEYFKKTITKIIYLIQNIAESIIKIRSIRKKSVSDSMYQILYKWTLFVIQEYLNLLNKWLLVTITDLKNNVIENQNSNREYDPLLEIGNISIQKHIQHLEKIQKRILIK